jgi:hypothetical protein
MDQSQLLFATIVGVQSAGNPFLLFSLNFCS